MNRCPHCRRLEIDRELLELEREEIALLYRELYLLQQICHPFPPPPLATKISFTQENPMSNPTEAGQTQVFTGTLSPAGSVLAPDAVATISSNDPAVSPTLDSTQLIVSVTYPAGWVESATTPLAFAYATTSATTSQALSATIVPSAPPPPPPVLATSIAFQQTT